MIIFLSLLQRKWLFLGSRHMIWTKSTVLFWIISQWNWKRKALFLFGSQDWMNVSLDSDCLRFIKNASWREWQQETQRRNQRVCACVCARACTHMCTCVREKENSFWISRFNHFWGSSVQPQPFIWFDYFFNHVIQVEFYHL